MLGITTNHQSRTLLATRHSHLLDVLQADPAAATDHEPGCRRHADSHRRCSGCDNEMRTVLHMMIANSASGARMVPSLPHHSCTCARTVNMTSTAGRPDAACSSALMLLGSMNARDSAAEFVPGLTPA